MLLLNRRLDFVSRSLRKKYDREYNLTTTYNIRVVFVVILLTVIGLPCIQYLVTNNKILDFKLYSSLLGIGVLTIFSLPLFFLDFAKARSGVICSAIFAIYCIILNVTNIVVQDNYLNDYQSYIISVFILLQPLLVKIQCKHFLITSLLNVIFCVAVTLFVPPMSQLSRVAAAFPIIAAFVLTAFCGYFLEKRWKYDFFRRQVMEGEAAKLQWAMSRDASLLRNIFPKNLSDELELQMTRQNTKRRRKTRKGVKGLITRATTRSHSNTDRGGETEENTKRDTEEDTERGGNSLDRKLTTSFKRKNETVKELYIPRTRSPSLPVAFLSSPIINSSPSSPVDSSSTTSSTSTTPSSSPPNFGKKDGQVFFTPIIHSTRKVQNPMKSISKAKFPQLSVTIPSRDNEREKERERDTKKNNDMYLEPFTPMINLPPVVTTPSSSVSPPPAKDAYDFALPSTLPRVLTSRGTALRQTAFGQTPNNQKTPKMTKAEEHTVMRGASHTDGSIIALSHVYPDVYVIYAELSGFSRIAAGVAPSEGASQLQRIFSAFDDIIDSANFEKIRTLGEGYLCVANMSIPVSSGGIQIVQTAQKMITEIISLTRVLAVDPSLTLRVGISFGSLIAGVTGLTKWNYDIFGKPYTEALMLTESAPPNTVAVSDTVYLSCSETDSWSSSLRYTADGRKYFILEEMRVQKVPNLIFTSSTNTNSINDFATSRTNEVVALLAQPPLKGIFFHKDLIGLAVEEPVDVFSQDSNDSGDVISARSKFKRSEISLDDFRTDFGKALGYTRSELDYEEKLLHQTKFNFRFMNSDFEKDFRIKAIKSAHVYTLILSMIFFVISSIYFCNELATYASASSVSSIPLSILLLYVASCSVFLVYIIFVRFFDYTFIFGVLSAVPVAVFLLCLVLIFYIEASEMHITNIVVAVLEVAAFVRVPIAILFIVQLAFATAASAIIEVYHPDLPNSIQYIFLLFLFVVITFICQLRIHKSLRIQFLAQKRIKHDIYFQKIAQHRSKLLMHNIFPAEIISRLQPTSPQLKQEITGVVDLFEDATIMFVNLVDIEELTNELDPANKFQVYNDLITLFDEATHSFGLEKIKTINTVYMVACGLPKKIPNHVETAIKLAIELYSISKRYCVPVISKQFSVRIGIATGPVVAGIIGKQKYSYDCWSETVHVASRMESTGWDGYLQLSAKSFSFASQKHLFQQRENLNVRGNTYMLQLSRFVTQ